MNILVDINTPQQSNINKFHQYSNICTFYHIIDLKIIPVFLQYIIFENIQYTFVS